MSGWWYRTVSRISHRFDWHHAPVIGPLEPGGGYQRWCTWCGFRQSFNPMAEKAAMEAMSEAMSDRAAEAILDFIVDDRDFRGDRDERR